MEPRELNPKESTRPFRVPRAKALLVYEDPTDLQFYCEMLEGYGYVVQTCNSYPEGVRRLADEAFDFVMVSQGTPKFEGRCVLKRAAEINRSLPVLVVARCVDMDSYLEAMQLGAVDYLVEPLTHLDIGRVLKDHRPIRSMAASG
jgi:DNA-binding NtrC family response regulator